MSDRYDSTQYGNRLRVSPSRAYHKYWQGYSEKKVLLPNGKTKIERQYTAPWKQHVLSGKGWVSVKAAYFLLTAASIALYLLATTRDTSGNRCWYVALAGLPAGFTLFLLLVMTVNYITNPRKMTLWEYSSARRRLLLISPIAAGLLLLTAVNNTLYVILSAEAARGELLCVAALALSSAAAFALFLIERKLSYTDVKNDNAAAGGSFSIR